MNNNSNFFHNFVESELKKKGLNIKLLTEEYIKLRLTDVMNFVNGILNEFKDNYKLWTPKSIEWFLNPMEKKWEYSYLIENHNKKICLLNFSSVYGEILHTHCTYVNKEYRNFGLNKLHKIKICQKGIDDNFYKYEGIWDKNNNGSIILYLKMGFKIENMRKSEQIIMMGDLYDIRNRAFNLYKKDN